MSIMVKRIQLTVDDAVFDKLKELKGERSWEQFLVEPLIQKTKEEKSGV